MAARPSDDNLLLANNRATAITETAYETDEQPANEEKASDGAQGDADNGARVRAVVQARVDGWNRDDAA